MRNLFAFDGPLMSGIMKLGSLIVVTLLWLLFCLPVITAGASTTAFYYTIQKNLKYSRGYTVSCFWTCFKRNLRQATGIWALLLVPAAVLFASLGAVKTLDAHGQSLPLVEVLIYLLLIFLAVYLVWVTACVARFENAWRSQMDNAMRLAIGNLPYSFLIALLFAGAAFVIWLMPPLVILMPGVAMWFSTELIEKAFRPHLTPEQRREEDERNMDWKNDYDDAAQKKETEDAALKEAEGQVSGEDFREEIKDV